MKQLILIILSFSILNNGAFGEAASRDTENVDGVEASVETAVADEVILDDPNKSKDWKAQTMVEDPVWGKSSCVASTSTEDGLSTLEVVAFYNSETKQFGEPMVHVITPFDVSFFEVEVTTDRARGKKFPMLPVNLPNSLQEGQEYVGARAMFDDRSDLVTALRKKNRVKAVYMDVEGEVKSLDFSLIGSSATLRAMFEHCGLEFSSLPLLPEPIAPILD